MKTEELKKLLKENRICFYSYWGKKKLIDLARMNKLMHGSEPKAEPEPELKAEPKPEIPKYFNYERLRNIRNSPISVKFIDVETKEEKTFPSIYKASKYLDNAPQTVSNLGKKKGIWKNKYQIII